MGENGQQERKKKDTKEMYVQKAESVQRNGKFQTSDRKKCIEKRDAKQ